MLLCIKADKRLILNRCLVEVMNYVYVVTSGGETEIKIQFALKN